MPQLPLKIVLIGFMGSGKSSTGAILARLLGCGFIDSDNAVIEKSGFNSIAEIFRTAGEQTFRRLESEVIRELLADDLPLVIATGGGLISDQRNADLIARRAFTVYLDTSFDVLKDRVLRQMREQNTERPLFRDVSTAHELFNQRLPIYRQNARMTVSTDNMAPQDVAGEILKQLNG